MKLDVSNALSHPGQEYPFSGLQAIADQEIGGDTVRIDECAVEGTFLSDEDGNISVKGKLKTVAHAPCANCLEDAQAEIENEFDEVFQRNGDMEDNEIFAYTGHEVELDKLVMSYAVMALPIRFLCREDCPGFEYRDPEALPKGKISKARKHSRRANWKLTLPGIGKCPQCGQMKLSHRVCKNCGYYNGVQVIVKKDEEKNA